MASGIVFATTRALDHDGWVTAARAAAAAVPFKGVEAAFVTILPSRRPDLRSTLGSYAVARHLPAPSFTPGPSKMCAVCGLP